MKQPASAMLSIALSLTLVTSMCPATALATGNANAQAATNAATAETPAADATSSSQSTADNRPESAAAEPAAQSSENAIATTATTSTYAHAATAEQNGVRLTVGWDDAAAGEPTTFHLNATGGSGAYKFRMDAPFYMNPGEGYFGEMVADTSRGQWMTWTSSDTGCDYEFTMTTSGRYYYRFYLQDAQSSVWSLRVAAEAEVSDDAHPSVNQIIENAVAQCRQETTGSEYDMALWLHDWTLDQLEYDHNLNYCSAESGLTRHKGTCESYQRIYAKLLNAAGIANSRITGNGHTWNAAKIDGKWCQMDLTWDDSDSIYGDMEQRHLYFGLTDELMAIAHSDHAKNYHAEGYAYRSTDLANNYFVRNSKADEWANKYADRIQQHLNAKETKFSIDADNGTFPPSISGIQNGIVAYAINQRAWNISGGNKADLAATSKVTTLSATEWSAKFDFAVNYPGTTTAVAVKMDVAAYKGAQGAQAAPERDGMAFAGWYSDEACTRVYGGSDGTAYARFVPVSELIRFQGCSLRDDGKGADLASLRFGYEFTLPSGSTLEKMGWDWSMSESGKSGYAKVRNYWLAGGGSARANVVLTDIARSDPGYSTFASTYALRGMISYRTADGTAVEVAEPEQRSATVSGVASAIASGGMASSTDRAYAEKILGSQTTVNPTTSGTTTAVAVKMDVAAYKGAQGAQAAPERDGMAFAGWYSDEACTRVYGGSDGTAYARFVPVSELIRFQGCSLRDDGKGADLASLRFGYEFTLPSGSTLEKMGWDWSMSESGKSGYAKVRNYWLAGGGSARANVVLTDIARSDPGYSTFASTYALRGMISYRTADGTAVEVAEPEQRSATVSGVASAIASGGMASSTDRAYANVILGTVKAS